MLMRIMVGAALLAWPLPAHALQDAAPQDAASQEEEAVPALDKPPPPEAESTEGSLTTKSGPNCNNFCSFSLTIAPDMSFARPFGDQDFTDALTLIGTYTVTQEFISRPDVKEQRQPAILDAQIEIASTLKLDGDDGGTNSTSSSIGTTWTLNYRPHPRLTLFTSYGVKGAFTGRFEDHIGSEERFAAGVRLIACKSGCPWYVPATTAELQISEVNSTKAADDVRTYQASAQFQWNFAEIVKQLRTEGRTTGLLNLVDPFVNVEISRRVFDNPDATTGLMRRDWNYFIFAGVDVTRWLNANWIAPEVVPFIKRVRFGYRYTENVSNIGAFDRATRAILPSLVINAAF